MDHVLPGDARPTNSDKEVLWQWIINEFKESVNDLDSRNGKGDRDGAVKVTKGAAQAFLGKAMVLHGDYAAAKEPLKAVINSGNYALVDGSKMRDLFHVAGDGCEEKILEVNVVDNDSYGSRGRWDYQANQSLFFRQMTQFPDFTLQAVGWGNNMAPTKKFVDAILANEAGSARQKAWMVSYEELLTDFSYSKLDTKADGTVMTKEEKLMEPKRGLDLVKRPDLYANYGWYFLKFIPYKSDLNNNSTVQTQENKTVMRYAEVLLLYAEACATTTDSSTSTRSRPAPEPRHTPPSRWITSRRRSGSSWHGKAPASSTSYAGATRPRSWLSGARKRPLTCVTTSSATGRRAPAAPPTRASR